MVATTANALTRAMGMLGSTYNAGGTLGCTGLNKKSGSHSFTSVIPFERLHTTSLSPQKTAGFAAAPK